MEEGLSHCKVQVKRNISYPHVLPSAETDAEHVGALGSLKAVEKQSSAPNAAITQERGTVTRNKNISSRTRHS